MLAHLCLCVAIVTVVAAIVANPEINVDCLKDSVRITWKVRPELVSLASRLFLGNCIPSHLSVLSTREGEANFNYKLNDCKFRRLIKGKYLIYENELRYRPYAKSKPADFTHTIKCVYKRPEGWIPPFMSPGSGIAEGHGRLVFHMALLNEGLDAMAKTNIIPLGSFIPIWAAVEQKNHQPLLLLLEECVAATTPELHHDSQVYPIITNKGCLSDSKRANSRFLTRYHSSAITLYLQSFKYGIGEEVYIHCKLVAWDPEVFSESKKACHYVKESESWELLDDPLQSDLCRCCDSTCKSRPKRELESQGLVQNSVLGPLIIVDPSDPRTHNRLVRGVKPCAAEGRGYAGFRSNRTIHQENPSLSLPRDAPWILRMTGATTDGLTPPDL